MASATAASRRNQPRPWRSCAPKASRSPTATPSIPPSPPPTHPPSPPATISATAAISATPSISASPIWTHNGAPITFLESNPILSELNGHFQGNYLHEESLLAAARQAGFATAVVGKGGPSFIQDVTAKWDGSETIFIDDNFGRDGGIPVSPAVLADLETNHLDLQTPASNAPNIEQQTYLARVAAKVVLPRLAASEKGFVMVFWSRDPDYSQHNARESIGRLVPGINGPSARAAVRNADETLATLREALRDLGIEDATDVFVTADHGFTTISKSTLTSPVARAAKNGIVGGDLPPGFFASDVAAGLHMPLFDADAGNRPVDYSIGATPSQGDGLIGTDPRRPDAVVAANGGSDLIYLPKDNAKSLAAGIVRFLLSQDYVSGIFVNDALGAIPGTLPMSRINLIGAAVTPVPSLFVSFRSFATDCENPLMCTAAIVDTPLREGQGNHGGFSRAETNNFMAAFGPHFKAGFVDDAPIGNADIPVTLAHVLGISLPSNGKLTGRVIAEGLKDGKPVAHETKTLVSPPAESGQATILNFQQVGSTLYFDAAGFAGKTVGLVVPEEK